MGEEFVSVGAGWPFSGWYLWGAGVGVAHAGRRGRRILLLGAVDTIYSEWRALPAITTLTNNFNRHFGTSAHSLNGVRLLSLEASLSGTPRREILQRGGCSGPPYTIPPPS